LINSRKPTFQIAKDVPLLRIDYATPEEMLPGMWQGSQTGVDAARSIANAFATNRVKWGGRS
jgi:hypothetical protein